MLISCSESGIKWFSVAAYRQPTGLRADTKHLPCLRNMAAQQGHRLPCDRMQRVLRHKPCGKRDRGDRRRAVRQPVQPVRRERSEEHTSELQSLMRIPYAVFCLKKKNNK